MTRVTRTKGAALAIATLLLGGGCASSSTPRQPHLSRQQMVERARQEIDRRKLPLPEKYEIKVEEGFSRVEARPPARIFGVFFRFPYRGIKDTVYIVWFDEGGEIDVADYRAVLPLD